MLYLFFVCRADGLSSASYEHKLASDSDAAVVAAVMLGDHPSCDHVNVWQGQRFVLRRSRKAGEGFGGAALHQSQ